MKFCWQDIPGAKAVVRTPADLRGSIDQLFELSDETLVVERENDAERTARVL